MIRYLWRDPVTRVLKGIIGGFDEDKLYCPWCGRKTFKRVDGNIYECENCGARIRLEPA